MTSLVVTEIDPPTITAWLCSVTTAADTVAAITTAVLNGYRAQVNANMDNGTPSFSVTLTSLNGYPSAVVADGCWAVWDGTMMSSLTTDQLVSTYTARVPLAWAATETAPAATAIAGSMANIVFPQPTSANGPWTYSVSQTDTTANATGPAATSGTPAVDGSGNVTLTVEGLTEGDTYTFAVTCSTQYAGISAVAPATSPITATG